MKLGDKQAMVTGAGSGIGRATALRLAAEFIERGVRVNAVAPGGIDTPLIAHFDYPERANPRLFDRLLTPMGFAQPEDVAALIAFLASDDAGDFDGVGRSTVPEPSTSSRPAATTMRSSTPRRGGASSTGSSTPTSSAT